MSDLEEKYMRRAMAQLGEQQAAAQQAGLGAQMAVDLHRPDRPQYLIDRMFGQGGLRLFGFNQGGSVPRPLPGFGGDIMAGQMRTPVPGAAPCSARSLWNARSSFLSL